MLKSPLPILVLAALLAAGVSPTRADDSNDGKAKPDVAAQSGVAQPSAGQGKNEDVFGLTRVHKFHLELSADEWEAMQAVVGRGPFGGGQGRGPQAGPQPPNGRSGAPGENRPPAGAENRPADQPPAQPESRETAQSERRPTETTPKRPAELHRSAGFGTEFPWAHGKLQAFGQTFEDVGVRYKGNGSYMGSSGSLKRNLKIDFNRYRDDQQFQGIKMLNLNAGGADPTRLREALGFEVFRAAGVPASRTTFVELTLTVPGKYDHELVGMYTSIEQVDKAFLKDRFKDSRGLLLKPEHLREFAYLGDDWDRYTNQYQPKQKPSKKQARRVIGFVRLLDKGSDEEFQDEIGNYLDVDEFLRFLAASAWLANMDSLFAIGHNFYIYLDPKTDKLNFLPWDLDLSFAGFPMMGSPDELLNLNLKHPHSGKNKLIDRLLAVPEIASKYDAVLADLTTNSFAKDRLLAKLTALESATQEPRAREQAAVEARNERRRTGPFGGGMGRSPSLSDFVEKRIELVAAQLAGTNKGYTPRGGFGPGGRGGFGPGNFMAHPLMESLDTNKDGKLTKDELVAATNKFFADADPEQRGKLDQTAIVAALERVMPAPPEFGGAGFGPPGAERPGFRLPGFGPPRADALGNRGTGEQPAPPAERRPEGDQPPGVAPAAGPPDRHLPDAPPERPAGFSPGSALATALLKKADIDHDDHVTLDEAVAAAESLFAEADSDKKSELDENKLATAINGLFPRPPGFGPPGFGPPGGGGPGGGPPGNGQPGFGRPGFGGRDEGGQGGRPQPPPAEEAKADSRGEEPKP